MSFEEFVSSAQALKGNDVSRAWLREVWDGADGDVNRASNHLIDTPEEKVRRTKDSTKQSKSSAKSKFRGSVAKIKKSAFPKMSDFPVVGAGGGNAGGGQSSGSGAAFPGSGGNQAPAGMMGGFDGTFFHNSQPQQQHQPDSRGTMGFF